MSEHRAIVAFRSSVGGLIAWCTLCMLLFAQVPLMFVSLHPIVATLGVFLGAVSATILMWNIVADLRHQNSHVKIVSEDPYEDALTSLGNHRDLTRELKRRLAQWSRQDIPVALLMIDMDGFRRFNDQHGQDAGDEMLRAVARRLSELMRGMDVVTRYGGEKFAIVLPGTSRTDAISAGKRVRAAISNLSLSHRGEHLQCTASVGVANARVGDEEDELIGRAMDAARSAKGSDPDYVCCDDEAASFSALTVCDEA